MSDVVSPFTTHHTAVTDKVESNSLETANGCDGASQLICDDPYSLRHPPPLLTNPHQHPEVLTLAQPVSQPPDTGEGQAILIRQLP
jgi:hypothetical protein